MFAQFGKNKQVFIKSQDFDKSNFETSSIFHELQNKECKVLIIYITLDGISENIIFYEKYNTSASNLDDVDLCTRLSPPCMQSRLMSSEFTKGYPKGLIGTIILLFWLAHTNLFDASRKI